MSTLITPSASSYVKNESWALISQGAEARVWKIPVVPELSDNEAQPAASSDTTTTTSTTNGQQSPPVKRTRLLEEKNHVSPTKEVQEQGDEQQQWMVGKERFKKSYRHVQLDERLTRQRCRMEARILEKCYNKSGENSNNKILLRVPRVHRLNPPILFLEYLPGRTVRDALEMDLLPAFVLQQQQPQPGDQADTASVLLKLSQRMGRMIRQLHNLGIVHGDLTTSNMMLVPKNTPNSITKASPPSPSSSPSPSPSAIPNNEEHSDDDKTSKTPNDHNNDHDDELALIDFGLAKNTESAEERAVDLYVLERALISTHPTLPTSFIETLLDAYNSVVGGSNESSKNANNANDDPKSSAATLRRLEQVRQRGRKRECFG